MPKFTVIPSDNMVYVEGRARPVDCSELPTFIHAIQWYGDANPPYGELEWSEDGFGRKLPNLRFSDFKPFEFLIQRWHEVPQPGGPNPNPPTPEPENNNNGG